VEERIVATGAIILGVFLIWFTHSDFKKDRVHVRGGYLHRDESPFGFWWRIILWWVLSVVFIILGLISWLTGNFSFFRP
tara:strand:+ start:88 stop:324 length:237 start_codon:yes stop_codon:yes gene_type:complete